MSNLDFAKSELLRLYDGKEPEDEYDRMGYDAVLEMVETFSKQGHSGFSASWTLSVLDKLLRWNPLTPLTGEDDEWNEVGDNMLQNKRCFKIFKDTTTGRAYNIDGRVFVEKDGVGFTGRGSQKTITFPYTVEDPEYINVGEDGEPIEGPSREELVNV